MGDRPRRRDDVSLPKGIALFVFELAVFPWHAFKGDAAVRRIAITRNAVLLVVFPALALWVGNTLGAVVGFTVIGGLLLFMIVADRRIEASRRAERARRAARVTRLRPPGEDLD